MKKKNLALVLTLSCLAACAAREGHPRGMVFLRGGVGDAEATFAGGSTADTDAVMAEFGFEAGGVVGGGLRLGAYQSDEDLLETSDAIDTDLTGLHFFPHLTIRPMGGPFRMPIRIGPEVRGHALGDTSGFLGDTDFLTIGGGIELEPEIDFFRNDRAALSVYGRAHAGVGVAGVSTDANDFDTEATTLDFEAGLRFQFTKLLIQGGYLFRSTLYDESDSIFGVGTFPESEFAFDGFFFSLGVRW